MSGELCVAVEAVDRADLGEQLCGGEDAAAGQLEQRRRDLRGPLFEFLVELGDRAVELADARDELACESHLQLRRPPGEPASDPLEVRGAAKHPQGDLVGRVELVQVPAQALLCAAALVDEVVAVTTSSLSSR